MTPRIFGCIYFIQDLSSALDKLSLRSIKCVFVGYFKTQKEYKCYNLSTMKYLVSTDVIFFKSSPYFSPQVPIILSKIVPPSLSMSLPIPASTVSLQVSSVETPYPPASKLIQDFRYVYTHRSKVPTSKPAPANPSSRRSSSSTISIFI